MPLERRTDAVIVLRQGFAGQRLAFVTAEEFGNVAPHLVAGHFHDKPGLGQVIAVFGLERGALSGIGDGVLADHAEGREKLERQGDGLVLVDRALGNQLGHEIIPIEAGIPKRRVIQKRRHRCREVLLTEQSQVIGQHLHAVEMLGFGELLGHHALGDREQIAEFEIDRDPRDLGEFCRDLLERVAGRITLANDIDFGSLVGCGRLFERLGFRLGVRKPDPQGRGGTQADRTPAH